MLLSDIKMSELHIAFDARHLTSRVLRGMDRYTVGLVRELVNQGIKVTLFHRDREPLNPAHIENLGCNVIGLRDYSGLYWEQVAVPMAILREKIDIYHAPAERGVPLFAPCPVVFTIHSLTEHSYYNFVQSGLLSGSISDYLGYDFKPYSHSFWNCLFRLQIFRSNHILTPSDFCRSEVIRFLKVDPSRITKTYLAVHEQFKQPPNSENENINILNQLGIQKPYIIYVGGYEPHKNVAGLIETFAIIKQSCPELMLVTVGSKSLPKTFRQQALALNLDVGVDVVFLVDITDELINLYDCAELFVTLSWRETFCLPALEALTRGLPVVGSKWGAFAEIVDHAGVLVNPQDLNDAASRIIQILKTKECSDLSKLAYQQAEKFNWQKTAKDTLNIYKNI